MFVHKKIMRQVIKIILLVFLVLSCENNKIHISIQIENSINDSINIYANGIEKIIIKNNDIFKSTLDIPSGYYNLKHGNQTTKIYLVKGMDLKIKINNEEFDKSISFIGDYYNENNYLKQKSLFDERNKENFKEMFSKNEKDFIKNISDLIEIRSTFIDSFENENKKLNRNFKKMELNDLNYRYFYYLFNYETAYKYYTKKEPLLSEAFLNDYENFDYLDDYSFKNSTYYKSIVLSYFLNSEKFMLGEFKDLEDLSKSKSILIKEEVANQGKYYLTSKIDNIDELYNLILDLSSKTETKNELTKIYENINKILPGNSSPEFINYENFLGGNNSMSDYYGKYIYIDVWATWCGPCIREIPYFEEIQKIYENKNIHFISISIDDKKRPVYNYSKWLNYVKENNLSGIHLFADNAWNSDFIKAYNINSIPRYLLIDIDGKIISADAPRPSDNDLLEKINSLKHINCDEKNCIV